MWQLTGMDRASQENGKTQEYTVVHRFIKDKGYSQRSKLQETKEARINMRSEREIWEVSGKSKSF